jgi:hypothetical protein
MPQWKPPTNWRRRSSNSSDASTQPDPSLVGKPKEFEGWVSGVGFVLADWSGAAQPDEEAPTKEVTEVKRLPLYGAQLSSRRLRIFVGNMPCSVRYWIEDGRRHRSLDVDNVTSSEVVASLADLPKNAFVVRASAKGSKMNASGFTGLSRQRSLRGCERWPVRDAVRVARS